MVHVRFVILSSVSAEVDCAAAIKGALKSLGFAFCRMNSKVEVVSV